MERKPNSPLSCGNFTGCAFPNVAWQTLPLRLNLSMGKCACQAACSFWFLLPPRQGAIKADYWSGLHSEGDEELHLPAGLEQLELEFPLVGHSHCDLDRFFSRVIATWMHQIVSDVTVMSWMVATCCNFLVQFFLRAPSPNRCRFVDALS